MRKQHISKGLRKRLRKEKARLRRGPEASSRFSERYREVQRSLGLVLDEKREA